MYLSKSMNWPDCSFDNKLNKHIVEGQYRSLHQKLTKQRYFWEISNTICALTNCTVDTYFEKNILTLTSVFQSVYCPFVRIASNSYRQIICSRPLTKIARHVSRVAHLHSKIQPQISSIQKCLQSKVVYAILM